MKNLILITIATFTFAGSAFSNSNGKFYQVTDNGKFQYTYWTAEGNDNAKAGIKPVTLRTFFLETEKNGLLPSEMSYSEFISLSVEEKQAILEGSQHGIIAAMEGTKEIAITKEIVIETATATPPMMSPVEAVNVTEESIAADTTDMKAPWIVNAVIRPGTDNNAPAGYEMTIVDNDELPWVVDLMVNEGKQIESKYVAEIVKTSKSLNASR